MAYVGRLANTSDLGGGAGPFMGVVINMYGCTKVCRVSSHENTQGYNEDSW